MQADKLMAALERFFFDIVGWLIPGSLLLAGLWGIFGARKVLGIPFAPPTTTAAWWFFVAVALVVGNGLATLGEVITVGPTIGLLSLWRRLLKTKTEKVQKSPFVRPSDLDARLTASPAARVILNHFLPAAEASEVSASDLRNIAMTIIPDDDKATTVRFMFLALMSQGVATVTLLLTVVALIALPTMRDWRPILLSTVITWLFIRRRFEFFTRSRSLPFSMGAAQIGIQQPGGEAAGPAAAKGIESVYLAGGHGKSWRDRVTSAVPVLTYRDPSVHEIIEPRTYTAWDLEAVRRSDVVLAYLDKDNPSGYGLAVEVGYAAAAGKHVIFVDEKSASNEKVARYLQIIHQTANVSFAGLDEALEYLKRLALMRRIPKNSAPESQIAGAVHGLNSPGL